MFQPLKDLLPKAAQRIHLGPQVQAGIVCAKAREVIGKYYSEFETSWEVRKFEVLPKSFHTKSLGGRLTIMAKTPSAACALHMCRGALMERFELEKELQGIKEIKIQTLD